MLDFLFYSFTLKYNAGILKQLFALGIKGREGVFVLNAQRTFVWESGEKKQNLQPIHRKTPPNKIKSTKKLAPRGKQVTGYQNYFFSFFYLQSE